ncbi:MAG TPA: hypothetical protein VNA16_00320 [Abditibacteriaceae bacterium]|nr:hypothetical protein [Abditibacteriaceae bacterium]
MRRLVAAFGNRLGGSRPALLRCYANKLALASASKFARSKISVSATPGMMPLLVTGVFSSFAATLAIFDARLEY